MEFRILSLIFSPGCHRISCLQKSFQISGNIFYHNFHRVNGLQTFCYVVVYFILFFVSYTNLYINSYTDVDEREFVL